MVVYLSDLCEYIFKSLNTETMPRIGSSFYLGENVYLRNQVLSKGFRLSQVMT